MSKWLFNKAVAKRARRIGVSALGALVAVVCVPAAASAATAAWVSPAPVKGPFTSCATPGYNSIQEAISVSPAKSTIHVCAGTYKEQVRIEKPDTVVGEGSPTLELPASPTNTTSSCDVQEAGYEDQDQVVICGAGKISVTGLTLNSKWTETNCAKQYYGILVGGGTKLTLTGTTITHAGAEPINGCQQGVALQIGHKLNSQVATAKLSGDVIQGYQKNGITIDGIGSSATIGSTTVKSEPTSAIATNGIQVSRGATMRLSGSTIEGNECNVAGHCSANPEFNEDAIGILFFEGSSGSSVKSSTISGNDYGIYNLLNAEAAKTTIQSNTLKGNRYWGIALDQGNAQINSNTISGPGNVGIQINQYEGQAFGAHGTGRSDTVSGMAMCALEGFSDNKAGDHPGSLTITKSLAKFNGNAQEICDNNTGGTLPISLT